MSTCFKSTLNTADMKKLLPRTLLHIVSPPSLAAVWSRPPGGHGKASALLWPCLHGCGPLRQGVESGGWGGGTKCKCRQTWYQNIFFNTFFLLIKSINGSKVTINDHAWWPYISRSMSGYTEQISQQPDPGGTESLLLWYFLLLRSPPMISRRQTAGIWNKDVEATTGCKRKLWTRKATVIMEHIHAVKKW